MILIRNVINLLRIFILLGPHRQNFSVSGTESVGTILHNTVNTGSVKICNLQFTNLLGIKIEVDIYSSLHSVVGVHASHARRRPGVHWSRHRAHGLTGRHHTAAAAVLTRRSHHTTHSTLNNDCVVHLNKERNKKEKGVNRCRLIGKSK